MLLALWLFLSTCLAQDFDFASPKVGTSRVEADLVSWLDTELDDPAAYKKLADREARAFPEGTLFPYVFPALTWTNLAKRDPSLRPEAREHIEALVHLMEPAVVLSAGPPDGDLAKLKDYRSNATMLGQYNLVLGCWKLVGGDDRFEAKHRAVSEALAKAMQERGGKPLDSYPALVWPFDTIPVVLSLHLRDSDRYAPLIDAHFAWVDGEGTDPATGLPWSRLAHSSLEPVVGPRGCDLSYRIGLLAQLDPERARDLYDRYTKVFWIRRSLATGFAEWPHGASDVADIDSGPVIMGLGTAATGLGFAATRAVDDGARWNTLERELNLVQGVLKVFAPVVQDHPSFRQIDVDLDTWKTGFFFGDICLLWATTWTDWGVAR